MKVAVIDEEGTEKSARRSDEVNILYVDRNTVQVPVDNASRFQGWQMQRVPMPL